MQLEIASLLTGDRVTAQHLDKKRIDQRLFKQQEASFLRDTVLQDSGDSSNLCKSMMMIVAWVP